MEFPKSALASVRTPDDATVPNSTMDAPPRTGSGMAATTSPTMGNKPRAIMMKPAAPTTKRLRTPVTATNPTLAAKAVWVNEFRTGARVDEAMSARRPLATRLDVILAPVISPTARMSAVVSVMVTSTTISMEMIAAISNVGGPKARGVGKEISEPSPMREKSAMPTSAATPVPRMKANKMDNREIIPTPTLESRSTIRRVTPARAMA